MLTKWRAIVLATVALLVALALAACGGDGDATPTPTPSASTPTPSPSPTATPSPTVAPAASDEPPERDLMDLARRYRGLPADAPRVSRAQPFDYVVGESETFSLLNLDGPSRYEVTATVRAVTEHAYLFVQEGAPYDEFSLQQIAADFETVIWAKVTSTFGEPWTPGIDADPRITVLHADLRGAGGYVSSADSFPREAVPISNEREMLYIDSGVLSSPGVDYNDLVAHELQHLVHMHADDGEDSWVNEGLSQVAAQSVGGAEVWIAQFLADPDLQLDFWPANGDPVPHYAASELFFSYLLDQYGGRGQARALINEPGDGWEGVDAYLRPYKVTGDGVFADWVLANWLDDDDGPYSHPNLSYSTSVSRQIGPGPQSDRVEQFAADYLVAEGGTFAFDGADTVTIGVPAHDGAFWWSGRGDSIDSRLTREIDLRRVTDAALRFDTWYETERGWDYAYVAASTDGGETWRTLSGRRTTAVDPVGVAYGEGFTGRSFGWVEETVDLAEYAGEQILLRFEYVTDDASNLTGFAVDNVALETDGTVAALNDGWSADGFTVVNEPLAQRFAVRVIDANGAVTTVPLDGANSGEIVLDGPSTIVVAAITRGTTVAAAYSWTLSP